MNLVRSHIRRIKPNSKLSCHGEIAASPHGTHESLDRDGQVGVLSGMKLMKKFGWTSMFLIGEEASSLDLPRTQIGLFI